MFLRVFMSHFDILKCIVVSVLLFVNSVVYCLLCIPGCRGPNSKNTWLAASMDSPECCTRNSRHDRLVCCVFVATHWPPLKEFTEGQWWHPTARHCDKKAWNNWRKWQLVVNNTQYWMMWQKFWRYFSGRDYAVYRHQICNWNTVHCHCQLEMSSY